MDHALALAPAFGRGFVSDGAQGTGLIFALQKLKIIGEAKAQDDTDCVVYDPASKRVFAMNGDSRSSTVIDAKSGSVLRTIDLGGSPEFAVTDGSGTIYPNIQDKNEGVGIDSESLAIKSRGPVARP